MSHALDDEMQGLSLGGGGHPSQDDKTNSATSAGAPMSPQASPEEDDDASRPRTPPSSSSSTPVPPRILSTPMVVEDEPLQSTSIPQSLPPSSSTSTILSRSAQKRRNHHTQPRLQPRMLPPGHELTPVIRNTSEIPEGNDGNEEEFMILSGDDYDDEEDYEGSDLRKNRILSLSVPSSGEGGSAFPLSHLQQRRRRGGGGGSGLMPPRHLGGGGKENGTSPTCLPPSMKTSKRNNSVGSLDIQNMIDTAKSRSRSSRSSSSFLSSEDELLPEEFDDIQDEDNLQQGQATSSTAALESSSEFKPLDPVDISAPIPLAPDRKFYSFNGRNQYRRNIAEVTNIGVKNLVAADAADPAVAMPVLTTVHKQYQPSREKSLTDIGVSATEEGKEQLSEIFNPPRPKRGENGARLPGTLHNPIPMDDRQWSIPSIRMANGLLDGSTTSYTCSEDDFEEDDILFVGDYDDDGSLSSKEDSSSSLLDLISIPGRSKHDTMDNVSPKTVFKTAHPLSGDNQDSFIIEEGIDKVTHPTHDDAADSCAAVVLSIRHSSPSFMDHKNISMPQDDDYDIDDDEEPVHSPKSAKNHPNTRSPRKKKRAGVGGGFHKVKDEKERKAVEWLRTVEIGRKNEFVAEAASSKFLTGGVKNSNVSVPAPTKSPVRTREKAVADVGIPSLSLPVENGTSDPPPVELPPAYSLNRQVSSPPAISDVGPISENSAASLPLVREMAVTGVSLS